MADGAPGIWCVNEMVGLGLSVTGLGGAAVHDVEMIGRLSLLLLCMSLLMLTACSASRQATEVLQAGPTVYRTPEQLAAAGLLTAEQLPKGSIWQAREHPDGSASYGYINDDQPVGFWSYTYPDGQVAMQGAYLYGGRKDGPWRTWWENGRRLSEGTYDRGQRHGEWQQWHRNGQRASRGEYSNDQRMGQWQVWWDNGRLQSQGNYINDRRSGRWHFFDQDGRRLPTHTHSHPGLDFPEDMNPPTILPSGHKKLPDNSLQQFRPGGGDDD